MLESLGGPGGAAPEERVRILVVEDDPKIASFLSRGLEAERFLVDVARDGAEGLERALSGGYDLIVLDLMLPHVDGLEILRRVRARGSATPVIALTARGEVEDRVRGLDAGADDYLPKPFSFVELLARVRARLRGVEQRFDPILRAGDVSLDTVRHKASRGGEPIELTPREYQLLEYFMRHPGEVLTRAMIADRVWGSHFDTYTNVIDVYVNYVRKKLGGGATSGSPIRTIRGVGYVFEPAGSPPPEPEPARGP